MEYEPIHKLAEHGFLFAPTAMGMTRSNRAGWPDSATNDKRILREWIAEGSNLVSVAKYGNGFNIVESPSLVNTAAPMSISCEVADHAS